MRSNGSSNHNRTQAPAKLGGDVYDLKPVGPSDEKLPFFKKMADNVKSDNLQPNVNKIMLHFNSKSLNVPNIDLQITNYKELTKLHGEIIKKSILVSRPQYSDNKKS